MTKIYYDSAQVNNDTGKCLQVGKNFLSQALNIFNSISIPYDYYYKGDLNNLRNILNNKNKQLNDFDSWFNSYIKKLQQKLDDIPSKINQIEEMAMYDTDFFEITNYSKNNLTSNSGVSKDATNVDVKTKYMDTLKKDSNRIIDDLGEKTSNTSINDFSINRNDSLSKDVEVIKDEYQYTLTSGNNESLKATNVNNIDNNGVRAIISDQNNYQFDERIPEEIINSNLSFNSGEYNNSSQIMNNHVNIDSSNNLNGQNIDVDNNVSLSNDSFNNVNISYSDFQTNENTTNITSGDNVNSFTGEVNVNTQLSNVNISNDISINSSNSPFSANLGSVNIASSDTPISNHSELNDFSINNIVNMSDSSINYTHTGFNGNN